MNHKVQRVALMGIALFMLTALFMLSPKSVMAQGCIQETLPTDGKWELCWEHRDQEGIVLTDIYYITPANMKRRVLKEASIAQIYTPYDDNSSRNHYVASPGLGGAQIVALSNNNCPTGTLISYNGINVLCQMVENRGYIYKYEDNQQIGYHLTLFSVSNIGGQHFIIRWRFYDDGTIEPSIGSTGVVNRRSTDARYGWPIQNNSDIGIGYVNNYYWRLNFDIGENGANDIVEEFNVDPTDGGSRKSLSVTRITSETGRSVDAQKKRSWRVRDGSIENNDGHSVSYHLEPLTTGNRYIGPNTEPWTANDIFFTKSRDCERFVSQNPTAGGCGADISQFMNGENIDGDDIVLWYRISYHHLPRSEYQPYIPLHWDGFMLYPRDWTAETPIAF